MQYTNWERWPEDSFRKWTTGKIVGERCLGPDWERKWGERMGKKATGDSD